MLCDVCKPCLNCAKLLVLYMSFRQPTSQFNLLSIKVHSCYKPNPVPFLIVVAAAIWFWELEKNKYFLTASVPNLYTGYKSILQLLSATRLLCFHCRKAWTTNCWKPRSSPTKWVILLFFCGITFALSVIRYSIKQYSYSRFAIPNHCQ